MGDFIDFTQFSVAVSCFGLYLFISGFKVRPSKSWESSALLKKILFFTGGLLLQIPVTIAIIFKPDVVTDILSTEKWSYTYLLINYCVIVAICIVVYIINLIMSNHNASK